MRVLIRFVIRKPGGSVERSEEPFDGELITIGRATDQTIHIPDKALPLEHSEILAKGNSLSVRANAGCVLFVNGEQVEHSRLAPGDLVEVGNFRLMVSDPVAGYDQVILVEPSQDEAEEVLLSSQMITQLDKTRLSKRVWSWASIVAILTLCLGVPAVGVMIPDVGVLLRSTPSPDDGQWDTGPLHSSHAFIGDDCTKCHVTAFTQVRDEQCVSCHTYVQDHTDSTLHELPELKERRCASCHREHHEPTALVRRDQALCDACHVELDAHTPAQTELRNVSDFGKDHPEFRATMLTPVGTGQATTWEEHRVGLDDAMLKEQSNLKFTHDQHLDPKGIKSPKGDVVLVCSDCHRPDPSGAYMEPVTMEDHCETCHRLQFDPQDLDREVPHGDPDVVLRTLQEYYARTFLLNQVNPQGGAPRRDVRRPGASTLTPEDRSIALSWARDRAEQAAVDLFERRTCKDCHEISVVDDPKHLSRWQVNKVRLARVWLPKSFFDHDVHRTETCITCHDAEASDESGDVLLPSIEVCRDCHAGEASSNLLASTCVDCHRFHVPGRDVMKPWVTGAARRPAESDLERLKRDGL